MKLISAPIAALITCLVLTAPAWAQDAVHHLVDLRLDPAQGEIELSDRITVHGEGRTGFALLPAFVVKSLSVDGAPQAPARTDGGLKIDLGAAGEHEVRITIAAKLSIRSQGNSTQGAQPPFLDRDGGFLIRAWLPHPSQRLATWTINGETPGGQKWLTPGRLTSESDTAEHYRASFSETRPSPLPLLITGPFEVTEKMLGDVRLRTYFHQELAPLADGYLTDTATYIERYAKQVGPYPYDGFSIVSGPAPVGLGLPGMTYMGRRVLALPFIRTSSLPHEVLHNWWGNAVDVDYQSGNWAEGLTTYMADFDLARRQHQSRGREMRLEWLRNYAALPPERDQALKDFTSKTHDATQVVGYGKTAYVFHMLWREFGPEVFDRALQDFYKTNRGKTAGWREVFAAFERTSGIKLDTFFAAWISRPGAPQLVLKESKADGKRLSFTLIQTQDGPPYPLTVPIEVRTATGAQRLRVRMTGKEQTFRLEAPEAVKYLFIDPDFDLFRRLGAGEAPAIFRDVTLHANTWLIVSDNSDDVKEIARVLAKRLMQRNVSETQTLPQKVPFILVGLARQVNTFLEKAGYSPPPKEALAPGDARAYVLRQEGLPTVLVAQAEDASALDQLARRLAHYKNRSFVVQDQDRVTQAGVWSTRSRALSASFNIDE